MQASGNERAVDYLLNQYPNFGIPHFQRGLIWNEQAKSDLIESLYENTPCGNIVMWKTNDQSKGIGMSGKPFKYLIVDGQQRINCLNEILNESEGRYDIDPDERIWCLNLSKVKELNGKIKPTNRQYSLFMKTKPPRLAKGRLRYNLIPLQYLLQENFQLPSLHKENMFHIQSYNESETQSKYIIENIKEIVLPKILDIKKRKFYVTYLSSCTISDVVDVFNRINSGGSRIQSEERAYATLVSMYEKTDNFIEKLFRTIHNGTISNGDIRNEVLKREKERNFGFKLFIRIFILICNYHFGFSLGSSSLSFSVLWSSTFFDKFEENQNGIGKLWQIAYSIIPYVNSILKCDLKCDDYRFLPETNSLLPIFQILIRYPRLYNDPEIEKQYRSHLIWLCLAYYLTSYEQKEILEIVSEIRYSNKTAWQCIRSLKVKIIKDLKFHNLKKWIGEYQTIQNRYLLLLYWLLRFNGIKDFSYEANNLNGILGNKEQLIDSKSAAQKQHIIPYSHLGKIYPELEESKRRYSTHEAHNIGNMTYISASLNSLDALSSEFANIAREPQENLKAHYLNSPNLKKHYTKILEKSERNKNFIRNFKAFTKIRQEIIAKGFLKFLEHFSTEPIDEKIFDEIYRIEPGNQIFLDLNEMDVAARIRALNYNNEIEDLLVRITKNAIFPRSRKAQSPECFKLKLTKKSPGRKERNILIFSFSSKTIKIQFVDSYYRRKVGKYIALQDHQIELTNDKINLNNNIDILRLISNKIKI